MPPVPLRRHAGVVAAVVLLLILLGCMSISIGKFTGPPAGCTEADGVFCQEGEVSVGPGELRQIFYPVGYVQPPNLEVSDTFHNCVLLHQQENSFTVRNDAGHSVTASWKARGMRAVPAPPHGPPEPVPPPAESTAKAG